MRIIDRYINNSIIKIFITTIFIFSFIYILIDITTKLDEIIDRKVPIEVLLRYCLSSIPIILVETSSIACLIATLMTFSGLNNNNEIIAMRTSGLNFWQITKPAILFSLIISFFVFLVNENFVPQATLETKKLRNEQMVSKEKSERKKHAKIRNLTLYGVNNRLYYIDTYDPQKEQMHGITIVEHDENQNTRQMIVALRGNWTGIAWKFYQSQITTFDKRGINLPVKVKVYKEKLMDIKETPEDFLKQRLTVSAMNIQQLNVYIAKFAESGAKKALNNFRVDLHQKYAYPFGNFVIVLIGLPFALMMKSRRRSTFTSLGIAISFSFLYYVTNAVSIALGKGGLLPPILSAWATPMLVTGIAIFIIENNF